MRGETQTGTIVGQSLSRAIMAHVAPLSEEQVPELAGVLARTRAAMGFVPNSLLTMAYLPQLTTAFSLLAGVTFGADLRALLPTGAAAGIPAGGVLPDADGSVGGAEPLPPSLVQLVAFACSVSAGCRYCQAHTSHGAHRLGQEDAKLGAILDFETDPAYSAAERAALALAFAAAAVPNETTEAHFQRLREHFTERQIVQLVAVVALFGFLNRWNDTMATQLEAAPARFAEDSLGGLGWRLGKHGS
jgi:AhpD family alkylhydroperoxidase